MYSVYDFINNDISGKHMRLGWRVEAYEGKIILRYVMLNFDWSSLKFIGDDVWDMFLSSASYANLKWRMSNAMKSKGRLYLDAHDISELKALAEHFKIRVDVDKIIQKTVEKKSEKMKSKTVVEKSVA